MITMAHVGSSLESHVPPWEGDVGRLYVCWGLEAVGEFSVLSSQFAVNLKLLWKHKTKGAPGGFSR